jgi:hypothetical protein
MIFNFECLIFPAVAGRADARIREEIAHAKAAKDAEEFQM